LKGKLSAHSYLTPRYDPSAEDEDWDSVDKPNVDEVLSDGERYESKTACNRTIHVVAVCGEFEVKQQRAQNCGRIILGGKKFWTAYPYNYSNHVARKSTGMAFGTGRVVYC
jgi:hypothetical protein